MSRDNGSLVSMKFVSLSKTVKPRALSSLVRNAFSFSMIEMVFFTYSFSDIESSPATRARHEMFHSGLRAFISDNMRGFEQTQYPSLIPGRQYNFVKAYQFFYY